jgi:hypothetical protein
LINPKSISCGITFKPDELSIARTAITFEFNHLSIPLIIPAVPAPRMKFLTSAMARDYFTMKLTIT